MKKIIAIILSLTLLVFTATACSKPQDSANNGGSKPMRIAIVQHTNHTSLDQIRDTISQKLKSAINSESLEIVTLSANGDVSALPTILQNEKSKNVDMVITIATQATQSAKSVFEGTNTPIIYAAVSDPSSAGLTGEDSKNITGVSNSIPSEEIVKLVSNFQPNYKKIGFLYTSSETNSVSTILRAKEYCNANGIAYEEASIAGASDLESAINSLIAKGVDVLYTGNDNTIASAMPIYTDVAYRNGIPVYCGADSMIADGGFATIGIDYVQLGNQTADIALRVKNGEKPENIPYEVLNEYAKYVNLQAADKLNMNLTDEMLSGYKVLVDKDGSSHFGK